MRNKKKTDPADKRHRSLSQTHKTEMDDPDNADSFGIHSGHTFG